jgi:hypothetical protein
MIRRESITATWQWIQRDHAAWPLRFWLEVLAWALSIGCSVIMMITVPDVPLLILYPMWVVGSAVYAWAAWTRGSFGMLANYMLLASIDAIALTRLIF